MDARIPGICRGYFPSIRGSASARVLSVFLVALLLGGMATGQPLVVGTPAARADRLVPIGGARAESLIAEYSLDKGSTWKKATVYGGTSAEARRACSIAGWNAGVLEGIVPAGSQPCLWNYHFDLKVPYPAPAFRLRSSADGTVVFRKQINLNAAGDTLVIDHQNVLALAGGSFPAGWRLKRAGIKDGDSESLFLDLGRDHAGKGDNDFFAERTVDDTPVFLRPNLKGWYRLYVGMEPYSAVRLWLSEDNVRYEVPNYYRDCPRVEHGASRRLCQEFLVACADMTGQDIAIAPGGTRFWRNVSLRYVRLVPMPEAEVAHYHRVRDLARRKGRPFAGYMEPCTPAHYIPKGTVSLREHIRNEVQLNRARGSTDVYMHAIRLGCKAWYHSDIVEREAMSGWSAQGDAMALGVQEAHAAGLKFFADVGMNSPYYKTRPDLTERYVREHPEFILDEFNQICFDYREPAIQDYVVSVLSELMTKYAVDGVNLDFARWGYRPAYDFDALVAVLARVDSIRRTAQKDVGHPITISVRIDYDEPVEGDEPLPLFMRALKVWAQKGYIDRAMVNGCKRVAPSTNFRHYVETLSDTEVEFWMDMYWGTWPEKDGGPGKDLAIARSWAAQGLEGGIYYYMRARPIEWEDINWQMRLIDIPYGVVRPDDW